jgi:soluble lytic murein transglycosylase-like protein
VTGQTLVTGLGEEPQHGGTMMFATRFRWMVRHVAAFFVHFAHGGLVTVGLVAMAVVAAQYMQHGGLRIPGAAGFAQAQAASAETWDAADESAEFAALTPELRRVRDYLARRYHVSTVALEPVLATAQTTGRNLGMDPLLLVAVIAIESSFNPFAESGVGAQGLMQVIPRFHMDKIGDDDNGEALFDPVTNVRVGALVLKEGLDRYGTLTRALQYYGGALSDPSAGYANKVFAMKARLVSAARRTSGA